jgi:hypothetical protein
MKTVSDFIKLYEDAAVATNTVSGGQIATKDVPLGGKGNIAKRKKVEEDVSKVGTGDGNPTQPLGHTGADDPSDAINQVGKDPMATIYAPLGKGPGDPINDKDGEKDMHLRKQQYQNDQMI